MWKMFSKAGQPGWASIIPLYNVYIMCKIAGRPGWWLLLFLIPLVNLIIAIIVTSTSPNLLATASVLPSA